MTGEVRPRFFPGVVPAAVPDAPTFRYAFPYASPVQSLFRRSKDRRCGCPFENVRGRVIFKSWKPITWRLRPRRERQSANQRDAEANVHVSSINQTEQPEIVMQIGVNIMDVIGIRIVTLCVAVLPGFAQEISPKDPAVIAEGVNRSTKVVIGTFKTGFHFPWFDGWHYSGRIDIEEVLYGGTLRTAITLQWKERYSSCLVCEKKSAYDGKKGIWFVTKANGGWHHSETKLWCGGPLPLDSRQDVVEAVKNKEQP